MTQSITPSMKEINKNKVKKMRTKRGKEKWKNNRKKRN